LKRYAAIGGGALALLLAFWLIPRMFGGKSESDGVTPSHPVTTTEEAPDTSSRQSATAAKAPSISAPPQNITVEKPKEEKNGKASAIQSPPAIRSRKSGFELVFVKGAAFQMGSPESEAGRDNDECQHTVTVAPFSIGKYEVTQADWREIMGSDPPDLYFKGCDQCPVERVSWDDIQGFLLKLNARYPGKNYRLPTEAEWEYAARGGNDGINTYFSYAGSDDLGTVAWYSGNSGLKTHPVGTKKANRLGLFDMSGNVWEWCRDTYKPYPCDNKNQAEGSFRVARGGGWHGEPRSCRSANRYRSTPSYRTYDLGFRLASSSF